MTTIEWARNLDGSKGKTWNPIIGCSMVDNGCANCYAMKFAHRGLSPDHRGLTVIGNHGPRWNGTVKTLPERLSQPLGWKKPQSIFVNSMSDLFHESIPFEYVAAVFGVMASTPQHTYQVLTKRPERAAKFFAWLTESSRKLHWDGRFGVMWEHLAPLIGEEAATRAWQSATAGEPAVTSLTPVGDVGTYHPWPLPNVHVLVSVSDQASAGLRIPILLTLPAAVRGVSYEPALGPVDFTRIRNGGEMFAPFNALGRWTDGKRSTGIDWIIVGGESGTGARPFDLAWMRSTIAQCKAAGVPVFCKQLGAHPVEHVDTTGSFRTNAETGAREYERIVERVQLLDRAGADPSEWPADLRCREFPR